MRATTSKACRALVRAAALLVPGVRRERWRREWLAELDHAETSGRPDVVLVRRAALSLRDAFDARRGPARTDHGGTTVRGWIDGLRQDLGFGVRALRRAPAFTALATGTIALGIGATTAIFSLVNGILLQPLPYTEPERLVAIWPEYWFSASMLDTVEPRLDAYEAIAVHTPGEQNLIGPDGAERIYVPRVSAGFFDVFGRDVVLGRAFAPGEDRPGDRVTVVSHGFWRDRLGADPDAVGGTIRLGGHAYTVIGVLRPGYDLLQAGAEAVIPFARDPESASYNSQDTRMYGRLAPGRTIASALPELHEYVDWLRTEWGANETFGRDASVRPLAEVLVGTTRPTLLLLFGAVGLTLLIATANVAGLLLTRALGRRRELSVRIALGARRGRVLRQLVTESSVLALVGLAPGLLLARLGVRSLVDLMPADTPRLQEVGIDAWAVAFSLGLALATGWIVGAVPALQASLTRTAGVLTESGRGASESRARRRLRTGIVLAEVALAVTLVAGAGVLLKSFARLRAVDPGFAVDGLVTFRVDPVAGTFRSGQEAAVWFDRLHDRLERLPSVRSASAVWKAPFGEDGGINGIRRTDLPRDPDAEPILVRWRPVREDYFATTGIRLIAGRGFEPTDDAAATPVAVISGATAHAVFGDDDPIGRPFVTSMEREDPATVVGVVDDLKLGGLDRESTPVVYRPYAQLHDLITTWGFYSRWMMLRVDGPLPESLAADVRRTVRAEDPTVLVADFTTLRGAIEDTLGTPRATATLMTAFAGTALLLGAVGIYGVMAYSVRQRRRELGIRMALGATRRDIVRDILVEALGLALAGGVAGLATSALLARVVRGFVFQVDPLDPWVLGGAVAAAAAIALLATAGPAWRAGRADPVQSLAAET